MAALFAHPASAKRAAVRSLFDRARNITLQKEDLQKEEHLTTTFRQNGYPLPFIRMQVRMETKRSLEGSSALGVSVITVLLPTVVTLLTAKIYLIG